MKEFKFKTKYIDEEMAYAMLGRYADGAVAMTIHSAVTDERLVTASVNLSQYGLEPQKFDNIFVKDWSENEGVLKALLQAGVVSEPVRVVEFGYVEACEVSILNIEEMEKMQ